MAEAKIFYQEDCNLSLTGWQRRSLSSVTAARVMHMH